MNDFQSDYAALAAASRSATAKEGLENVRQKHLTSAATWDSLAVSAKGMELLREKRLAGQAEVSDSDETDPEPAPSSSVKPA